MELVNVTSRSSSNVIEIKRLKCGRKLTAYPQSSSETTKAIVFYSPDYDKKLKYPKKANCRAVLEVPKKTILYVEWIEMDIENPKVDKCKGDYLRIKGPEKAKFYCGELN